MFDFTVVYIFSLDVQLMVHNLNQNIERSLILVVSKNIFYVVITFFVNLTKTGRNNSKINFEISLIGNHF